MIEAIVGGAFTVGVVFLVGVVVSQRQQIKRAVGLNVELIQANTVLRQQTGEALAREQAFYQKPVMIHLTDDQAQHLAEVVVRAVDGLRPLGKVN